MPTLRAADYEAMLDFIAQSLAVEAGSAFPGPVLDSLRRVVPCDAVSYREWAGERTLDSAVAADDAAERTRIWSAYTRFRRDDPLPGGPTAAHDLQPLPPASVVGRPLMFSDVVSERTFRATGLYSEICRPLGVKMVMKLFLPTDGATGAAFVFDTSRSNFTDTDRAVLERLYPHLVQLRRNTRLRTAAPQALARLTPRERVVLARAAAGETNSQIAQALFVSVGTVRKHLEHVYEKLEAGNRAAATAIYSRAARDETVQ